MLPIVALFQLSPYLTMLVFSILGGLLYSWMVNKRGWSKACASKVITTGALYLALCAFLAMRFATTALTGTLVVSAALGALAFSRGGWSTNHAEIAAPEHGSMLFSVANCISSITSVVGISVTGKLLDAFGGARSGTTWMVAMGLVGALCGVCGTFYAIAAGGDRVIFSSSSGDDEEASQADTLEMGTGSCSTSEMGRATLDSICSRALRPLRPLRPLSKLNSSSVSRC